MNVQHKCRDLPGSIFSMYSKEQYTTYSLQIWIYSLTVLCGYQSVENFAILNTFSLLVLSFLQLSSVSPFLALCCGPVLLVSCQVVDVVILQSCSSHCRHPPCDLYHILFLEELQKILHVFQNYFIKGKHTFVNVHIHYKKMPFVFQWQGCCHIKEIPGIYGDPMVIWVNVFYVWQAELWVEREPL